MVIIAMYWVRPPKECRWRRVPRREIKSTLTFRDEEQKADLAKETRKEWPGQTTERK